MTQHVQEISLKGLPFHLMMAGLLWQYSNAALTSSKHGSASLNSNPMINPLGVWPPELRAAIQKESEQRFVKLLSGVNKYQSATKPPHTPSRQCSILWQQGSARLLDYGGNGQPVFIIPSLVNKYYVLDLAPDRSLVEHLAANGFRPLVMDWASPTVAEQEFDCAAYITGYIAPALRTITEITGTPPIVVGYCMGGLFAIAAALLYPRQVKALGLLATPWDFHSRDFKAVALDAQYVSQLEKTIATSPTLPADMLQTLIYTLNPWVFHHKFRQFADMPPESDSAKDFLTLEHWVNDGVPLVRKVAKECLIDWIQHNSLSKLQWRVGHTVINPAEITHPSFIAVPSDDRIVPVGCAMPLTRLMPHARLVHPSSGHVGMITGRRARSELWEPLTEWLKERVCI